MSDPADSDLQKPPIDKSMAYIVYVLYLVGYLVGGAAALIGVVIAYLARRRASDQLLRSHYSWQIQIFWWSLLAFVLVALVAAIFILAVEFWLLGVFVGVISALVITLTVVVFSIRGMLDLSKNNVPSERYVI